MNRLVRVLTACIVCSVVACGDDGTGPVTITLFEAAPDAIEVGQTTKLLFVVNPADAQVTIEGLGNFTGRTEAAVSPTATTTYHLTAIKGKSSADTTITVTVGPQNAVGIKLDPASITPTAGQAVGLTLTAIIGSGKPAPGFRGTVHLTSTDAKAVLPADVVFTAADAGVKQVMVTLETAGLSTLTGTDIASPGTQGAASVTVQPGAASGYDLTTLPPSATAGDSLVLSITAHDIFGNVATTYAGQVQLTATDPRAILPAVGGFTAGTRTVSLAFLQAGLQTATVTEVAGSITPVNTSSVSVGAAAPSRIAVTPANTATTAGTPEAFNAKLVDVYGNVCTNYLGTVHFASTDANALIPPDFAFTAGDAGAHDFSTTLKTAGTQTLTLNDTATAVTGANAWTVGTAGASVYQLTALPPSATAGDSLVLSISVRDAFNNIITSYAGQAQITSTDPRAILPVAGGFNAGVRTVSIAFIKAGSQTVTVSEVAGALSASSNSVAVAPGAPFRIAVTAANSATTAGTPEAFSAQLVDAYDNVCTNYLGTVHFASTDANAVVPADFVFTAGDAGAHSFSTTLKTAGTQTLALRDTASSAVTGTTAWTVGAAAPSTCTAGQTPASAVAGSVVGVAVVVHDAFNNVATTYAGTVALTASDFRATLPPNVTYVPILDAGSHAFSAALFTTGLQTLTATDTADPTIHCNAIVTVTPAAPKITLTVPGSANAGYPVSVGVVVKDLFDNGIPNYAGTMNFTSSDTGTGAAAPATITFTGSEGGVATTSATFVTLGAQTITASDGGSPAATGTSVSTVHGLVYTAPASGRVRLVTNVAQSNTQVVQLDLIANERLEISSFFGGGPGSFAAGMNLPLDTTRAAADTTLFIPGAALPPGTGTRAAVGRIGTTDHVLYTGVSRKRVTGDNFTQATEVQAGQVFYSVRLKLQQAGTVGPVFDGAQPSVLFRAAVRDQYGDDFVSQSDFGLGKLEIR